MKAIKGKAKTKKHTNKDKTSQPVSFRQQHE
jgi:hypothetical protein